VALQVARLALHSLLPDLVTFFRSSFSKVSAQGSPHTQQTGAGRRGGGRTSSKLLHCADKPPLTCSVNVAAATVTTTGSRSIAANTPLCFEYSDDSYSDGSYSDGSYSDNNSSRGMGSRRGSGVRMLIPLASAERSSVIPTSRALHTVGTATVMVATVTAVAKAWGQSRGIGVLTLILLARAERSSYHSHQPRLGGPLSSLIIFPIEAIAASASWNFLFVHH